MQSILCLISSVCIERKKKEFSKLFANAVNPHWTLFPLLTWASSCEFSKAESSTNIAEVVSVLEHSCLSVHPCLQIANGALVGGGVGGQGWCEQGLRRCCCVT